MIYDLLVRNKIKVILLINFLNILAWVALEKLIPEFSFIMSSIFTVVCGAAIILIFGRTRSVR